jgi:hypothetical protein
VRHSGNQEGKAHNLAIIIDGVGTRRGAAERT